MIKKIVLFLLIISSIILGQSERYPIILNDKWGYIDFNGKIVIQPQYIEANPFSEDFAFVKIGEIYDHNVLIKDRGFININGDFVSHSEYQKVGSLRNGRIRVKKTGAGIFTNSSWGFVDSTFREIIEPIYTDVGNFSEGLAWVRLRERFLIFTVSDKYGYINKKGEVTIPLQYEKAGEFSEGLANITIEGKKGFIDKTGNIVINPRFESVGFFSESLARVRYKGKWGYINNQDSLVISFNYDRAFSFSDGLALVEHSGKWVFIDCSGKIVLDPKVEIVNSFQEELAAVYPERNGGRF